MGVTILVPTYNMSDHLRPLCESILRTGLLHLVNELLFVDDGSTDRTSQTLVQVAEDPNFQRKIRILTLPRNSGRFTARFEGCKAAAGEWILFLDTRLTLREDFAQQFRRVIERAHATVGWVQTDVHKNIYCLYWQRSHESVFPNHYAIRETVELTSANYDSYLKGTGVFFCRTKHFREICSNLEHTDVRSDDTLILKEILKKDRLFIDPNLAIWWEPRSQLMPFLMRFFERGPGFVEYHVFKSPGRYAAIVLVGLVLLITWFALSLVNLQLGLALGCIGLLLGGLSALRFGKTWKEGVRLMPLQTLVLLFFGFGVLWGLLVNLVKPRPQSHP